MLNNPMLDVIISMQMQNLVKIHQSFPKILSGNKNVLDGQTDGQMDNLKTVYSPRPPPPPPYFVCGAIIILELSPNTHFICFTHLFSTFSPSEGPCCTRSCGFVPLSANQTCKYAQDCSEASYCRYPLPLVRVNLGDKCLWNYHLGW